MSGLESLSDEEPTQETSGKPSVSYLYIYEPGRDEIENWDPERQELMARAYEVVSDGGIVRSTLKRSGQYRNIHDFTAEFMVGVADVFDDGDFSSLMDLIGPDADALAQYLEENPEVWEELQELAQG